jgi:hypothetical protein
VALDHLDLVFAVDGQEKAPTSSLLRLQLQALLQGACSPV